MTQAEKNSLYLCLKCGISTFTDIVNTNLSIGKCSEETMEKLAIASFLLDVFCGYNPECTTTYNYTIQVTKGGIEGGDGTEEFQADLVIDGVTLATYTGSGTAVDIVESWNTQVNTNSETTGFASSVGEDTLTIWTCNAAPATTAPELVEIDLGIGSDILSYLSTSIAATTVDNMYNCITDDQACEIVTKIKYLVTDCGC